MRKLPLPKKKVGIFVFIARTYQLIGGNIY